MSVSLPVSAFHLVVALGVYHQAETEEEWEAASPFWDAPDRNDHASALWVDEEGTLYHFNGLSAAATWGSLATILRTSTDNGATWQPTRFPDFVSEIGSHSRQPINSAFRTVLMVFRTNSDWS